MPDYIIEALAHIAETQRQMLTLVHESKIETSVLQAVCASLAVALAKRSDDPRSTLDTILADIEAYTLTRDNDAGAAHSAKTIEHICSLAEAIILRA